MSSIAATMPAWQDARRLHADPLAVGELEEVLGVAPAQSVGLTRLIEPVEGELPNRAEHREALAAPLDEALLDERLELVEIRAGDTLRRDERPAADEDREPSEEHLLVGREQLVAPRDRVRERSLPLRDVTASSREQREAAVQPGEEVGRL